MLIAAASSHMFTHKTVNSQVKIKVLNHFEVEIRHSDCIFLSYSLDWNDNQRSGVLSLSLISPVGHSHHITQWTAE